MVKEEIMNGIEISVTKGSSLKQAMMSFYKAGYPKEDIEKAAKEFQKRQQSKKVSQQNNPNTLISAGQMQHKQNGGNNPKKEKEKKDKSSKEEQQKKEKEIQKQQSGKIQNQQVQSKNEQDSETEETPTYSLQRNSKTTKKLFPYKKNKSLSQQELSQQKKSLSNVQNQSKNQLTPRPKKRQGVSDYENKKPNSGNYIMLLYIIISILLFIGIISALFIFKEDIISFFERTLSSL